MGSEMCIRDSDLMMLRFGKVADGTMVFSSPPRQKAAIKAAAA